MNFFRRIFLVMILIGYGGYNVSAQSTEIIDSLKHQLDKNISNFIRIQIYSEISKRYARTHKKLDTAKLYADSTRLLSEKNSFQKGIALSNLCYGIISRYRGNVYKGLNYLQKYTDYMEQKRDSIALAEGLYLTVLMQIDVGNYQEGLVTCNRVLEIYDQDEKNVARILNTIGNIQRELGRNFEAIKSYKKAIEIKKKYLDSVGVAITLENLGSIYIELDDYEKGKSYLKEALAIAENQKINKWNGGNFANLGNLHTRIGNYPKALTYHLKALEIRKKSPSRERQARSFFKVGDLYFKLKNYKKAQKYLNESLKISEEINAKLVLLMNYESLVELNKKKGNFEKALLYQDLYNQINDSIFNIKKLKEFTELETKYEVAQKDQEILILKKEQEVQQSKAKQQAIIKNGLIIGIISLIIIVALILYTYQQRLKNQKLLLAKNDEIKMSNLQEQLTTLEIKALRAQMNPHFLFNSLNSINTMILQDENENASRYLAKFSKLVRLMLENSEYPQVSLKSELAMLSSYIEIEAIRFDDKIDFITIVDNAIDQETTFLPSMVLQPFVENAIWHGLLHKEEKGLLTIIIKKVSNQLECKIIDNGIGREKSLNIQSQGNMKKKSMGIKITTDRLMLLTRQNVDEVIHIIDLKDQNNNPVGTQVNIIIPIQ